MNVRIGRLVGVLVLLAAARPLSAQLVINIIPDAGLLANPAALAAFQRAAAQWTSKIFDPVTININAGLAPLAPGVIGQAGGVMLYGEYDEIVVPLKADSAGRPDNAIVAALPTIEDFRSVRLPGGVTWAGGATVGSLSATKANLKAIGFGTALLDSVAGTTSDGTITFNSDFDFAYTRAALNAGNMDFETVAAHEIGHILGFISEVDNIAAGQTDASPTVLDLFRFADADTVTVANFATLPRDLRPGVEAVTSDGTTDQRMSTGTVGGDGRQASHWKDGDLTFVRLGMMDPTLAFGDFWDISDADFRALDLIGYDLTPVPEPAFLLLPVLAAALVLRRRAAIP